MAEVSGGAGAVRNRVAIPYPLPDWIASHLGDEFDFVLVPDGPADVSGLTMLLTSGTEDVSAATLTRLPDLRYICCIGSGYEGVDTGYAAAHAIAVSNSAIITAEDVADHLVALMLSHCCDIPGLDRAIRDDRWHKPIRRSIRECKIGIFGFGAIGQAAARRITAFGADIRWSGPRPKDTPYPYVADLGELAEWADILLVTARADRSNVGLIGDTLFNRLGPDSLIVNVSRGSIIDEDALIAALRSGRLGGAALDVFQSEPTPADRWGHVPNIILSPHVGGYASGVRRGIADLVQANLRAFFANGEMRGLLSRR